MKSLFQSDYFFVVVAANNLTPVNVPSVMIYRHLANGVGEGAVKGAGVPNIYRCHIGTGTVIDGAFGVLDHEIGHNWGVFIGTELGNPHWASNSTAKGQMATRYSDDRYATVKQISSDPVKRVYLYLQGLSATFPDC